ncbi:sigma-70 family RNA polymerase sigma factor [Streptodolium elevatio]
MRAQIPDVTALAAAARAGDIEARDALITACLPLVYNVVGRALDGHADVDDVVQETLLRVVDGLGDLRDPARFRSWLVAIAMNQVRDRAAAREKQAVADLDAAREVPDPHADFVGVTILRLGLSGQRREVAEATRWLDEDDRSLLALWWLEAAGDLTRAELAESLGLSAQHAAVRVQRMKAQLEIARGVVRALAADPRCAELEDVLTAWDGKPSGLWRKRIARHVRECDTCAAYGKGLVPAERLLAGVPLVVPMPYGHAAAGDAPPLDPASASANESANAVDGTGVPQNDPGSAAVDPAADPSAAGDAAQAHVPGAGSEPTGTTPPDASGPSALTSHLGPLTLGTAVVAVLAVLAVLLLRPDGGSPGAAAPASVPAPPASVPAPAPTPPPSAEPSAAAPPPATSAPPPPSPTRSAPSLEQQVLDLVNVERAKAGCGPVRLDPKLHSAAQKHAQDMAARRYFDHQAPDGTGPGDRITAAGYRWSAWAENLHQGPTAAPSAVTTWMDSSVHRKNMLDCDLTQMGVGTASGPRGMLWTQVLAAPM